MTQIVFITDQTVEERGYGGAEITIHELAKRAPKGIDVAFVSKAFFDAAKAGSYEKNLVSAGDLVVFSNIALWDRADIDIIRKRGPYIKMEFDYGFCKNHLKECEDGCKSCVEDGWYREFLQGAERIFFTCPAQKDWYRKILGTVADNSILNPSWIDPDRFPHLGWRRTPNTTMYHGRLFPHKGVLNVVVQAMLHPEKQYTFVGDGPPQIEAMIESVANCHIIRQVTPELIPYLLNATEEWAMLSNWDDTGPMSAVEAYLCGARIVHNQRLGYFSYPWDWNDSESVRTELKNIASRFWGEIQRILREL